MTDRELLELAAKAANPYPNLEQQWALENNGFYFSGDGEGVLWNPLTDDGDALRLAVKLNLSIRFDSCPGGAEVNVYGEWDDAPEGAQQVFEKSGVNATRRAIVRAAAEIGRAMP